MQDNVIKLTPGWYSVFELLSDPERYGDFVGHYVAYTPFPENTVCVFSEEETGYKSEQRFLTKSNGLNWQMSTDANREQFFLVADNSVDYELAVVTSGDGKLTDVSVNVLKDRIANLYSNKNLHLVGKYAGSLPYPIKAGKNEPEDILFCSETCVTCRDSTELTKYHDFRPCVTTVQDAYIPVIYVDKSHDGSTPETAHILATSYRAKP